MTNADGGARPARRPRVQYAALPYRRTPALEVLLVTARESRRWVIPKGWPMKGRKPHAAAAQEALEEAGVEGKVGKTALGDYAYAKRQVGGPLQVRVFPLQVVSERPAWREMGQRERRWFPFEQAAAAVDEPELRRIILAFGAVRVDEAAE